MCDVRQLAKRPISPEGQQLLTVDSRGWGEDPGKWGVRKGFGRREIRGTMLTILLLPPSLPFISDKNILIL